MGKNRPNYNGRGRNNRAQGQNRGRRNRRSGGSRGESGGMKVAKSVLGAAGGVIGFLFKPVKLYFRQLEYTTMHWVPKGGTRLYWKNDKIVSHSTKY